MPLGWGILSHMAVAAEGSAVGSKPGWLSRQSLRYTGIESHPGLTHYGLYDTVVARD